MGDWLVRDFTTFGAPVQNWMLIALALIAGGIVVSWWLDKVGRLRWRLAFRWGYKFYSPLRGGGLAPPFERGFLGLVISPVRPASVRAPNVHPMNPDSLYYFLSLAAGTILIGWLLFVTFAQ
jgi:hypothetical protein